MLQRDFGVLDEPVVGPTAQLPHELRALRDARRSERVPFGRESAGGVDDAAAAVRDVARSDHLVRFSRGAQPQGVERDHLVGGEAVVQFAYFYFGGGDAGFG